LEDPAPLLIAAYQQDNFVLDRVHHIPTVDEITFPGIALVGTCPTVYKTKVAAELSNAVMGGTFSANSVVIYLQMPRLSRGNSEVVQSPHPFTM
jgi:hypothetical protein